MRAICRPDHKNDNRLSEKVDQSVQTGCSINSDGHLIEKVSICNAEVLKQVTFDLLRV